jgi:cytochrome c
MTVALHFARIGSAALFGSLAAQAALAAPLPKPASFAMCGVCHKVASGEKSTIGPNLWGVNGRKAGTLPGFIYSNPMKASNITWTRAELLDYIAAPAKKVPGTKMAYAGQKDPKQAELIVDYVLSLK